MTSNSALRIKLTANPADVILSQVGDLEGYKVHGARILLAIYERAKQGEVKSTGGIIIPETSGGTLDEDRWQSKICLVLKKGPIAFKDDNSNQFHGDDVSVGDWVAIRPTDGWQIEINGQRCRIVRDSDIQISVPDALGAY